MRPPPFSTWLRHKFGSKWQLLRFLLAGIPTFCGAVFLNRSLARGLQINPLLAYAIVLVTQMSVNFLICRYLVFENRERHPIARAYIVFMLGNAVLRLLDWSFYAGIVSHWPDWYLEAQIANVLLFGVAKYFFARSVFERKLHLES